MRTIIPETEQIVALDTGIAWALRNTEPPWVATFITMREHGYHFCISDTFLAEFLNQFETGRLTPTEFRHAVEQMDRFISRVLPILPGKRQLYQMAGIHDPQMPPAEDPEFTRAYSTATWSWISSLTDTAALRTTQARFTHNGQAYVCPFQSGLAATELQTERDEWSAFVRGFDPLPKDTLHQYRSEMLTNMRQTVDGWATCMPPMSVRLDLWQKSLLETAIQRNQSSGAFNPDSDKRRNDSIDSLLKLAFLLPAYVCTLDRNFTSRFAPIDSFQKVWLVTPEQLALAWTDGTNPRTQWP
jgi:hypothetical protein